MLAFVFKVFGTTAFIAKLYSFFLFIISLIFFFLISKHYIGSSKSFLSTLAYALSPIVFAQSTLLLPDLHSVSLILAALYFQIKNKLNLAILFCCASVLYRETNALWSIFIISQILAHKRGSSFSFKLFVVSPLILLFLSYGFDALKSGMAISYPGVQKGMFSFDYEYMKTNFVLSWVVTFFQTMKMKLFFYISVICISFHSISNRLKPSSAYFFSAFALLCFFGVFSPYYLIPRYLLPAFALFFLYTNIELGKRVSKEFFFILSLVFITVFSGKYFYSSKHQNDWSYENNMEFVDILDIHVEAAKYLERYGDDLIVATTWPLDRALSDKKFGLVENGYKIITEEDLLKDPRLPFDFLVLSNYTVQDRADLLRLVVKQRSLTLVREFNRFGKKAFIFK